MPERDFARVYAAYLAGRLDLDALVGDTFPLIFSRIPGGLDVLLVVYAFDSDFAASAPIGVACAEATVPEKGATSAPIEVSGGEMTDLR